MRFDISLRLTDCQCHSVYVIDTLEEDRQPVHYFLLFMSYLQRRAFLPRNIFQARGMSLNLSILPSPFELY